MDDNCYDPQSKDAENLDVDSIFNVSNSKSLIDRLFPDDVKALDKHQNEAGVHHRNVKNENSFK